MPAYVIAQVLVKDPETYAEYLRQSVSVLEGFPAQVLVSDDGPDLVEGEWNGPRTVVVEFPSKREAVAWYESEQYQRTIPLRNASTITNLVIAAGVGG
jgi:uncharacterized protein (DUF1330 family)